MLPFLTPQSLCNCTHRNFCSKTELNFECLGLVGPPNPFLVTSRRAIIARAVICIRPPRRNEVRAKE
jgi:hypothetical protein